MNGVTSVERAGLLKAGLFVGPMWFALAALLIGVIWKMWHDYRATS